MAGKKPVWVDEDAHAILKKFAKLTRNSMVEVASALVLDKLSQLDPASGLEPVSADPVVDLSRPQTIAQKPVSVNRSVSARKPRWDTNAPRASGWGTCLSGSASRLTA